MSRLDEKFKKYLSKLGQGLAIISFLAVLLAPAPVFAGKVCGEGDSKTTTSIDIGCKGKGNSITDATFAIIRFLTNGVGVILVASMIVAGIQYSASKGDPNGMNQAINRIRANVFALLLFVFAYALLNYIIPGSVLHS